jgi:hypothetical protein
VPPTSSFDIDLETRSGSIHTSQPIGSSGRLRRRGFRGSVRGGGAIIYVGTRSGSINIE